ncbi:hypothetical protein JCM16106_11590 [Hydrogenophilus islandicus]
MAARAMGYWARTERLRRGGLRRLLGALLFPLGVFLALLSSLLYAASPAESGAPVTLAQPLNDPVLEQHALTLGRKLRCLVCQNQSIADSNAELAHDLMNQVRAMLREGKSDQEIVDFLVARYGDFVLLEPPIDLRTLLLWTSPFVLAAGGLWGLWAGLRRREATCAVQLDAAAKARADALLGSTPSSHSSQEPSS